MKTLLDPAIHMSNQEYQQYCKTLNHNAALDPSSVVPLNANEVRWYYVKVPNPFPAAGFWLGNLGENYYTLKVNSSETSSVVSGTGVPSLEDVHLLIDTTMIDQSMFPDLRRQFRDFAWHSTEVHSNELASQAINPTAEVRIKLENFRDKEIGLIVHGIRAVRNNVWATPSDSCRILLQDRNQAALFTAAGETVGYNRYVKG